MTKRNILIVGEEKEIIEEMRGTKLAAQVVICNYGNLIRSTWLYNVPWRAVVIDESHHIRSSTSEQAKAVIDITKEIPHKYLLSDTDFISEPFKIMIQLEIAGRLNEVFGGHKKFLARYQSYKEYPGGWRMGEAANQEELYKLMRENCYVKNEVK